MHCACQGRSLPPSTHYPPAPTRHVTIPPPPGGGYSIRKVKYSGYLYPYTTQPSPGLSKEGLSKESSFASRMPFLIFTRPPRP